MALIDSLTSYWKFDESSGDAADSHGSNTLTNTSVTYANTAPAIINNYAVFSSANFSKASVFNFAQGDSMSISFWFYTGSYAADQAIIGRRTAAAGGWNINIVSSTKIRLAMADTLGDKIVDATVSALSTNTWYHVVHTTTALGTSGSTVIYLNASSQSLAQVVNDSVSPDYTGIEFQIGSWDDGSKVFGGRMDEVGIWSRALTSDEVTSLYNGGAGFQYPFSAGGATVFTSNMLTLGA